MSKPKTQQERNAVEIKGLSFKDLLDCFILGAIDSSGWDYVYTQEAHAKHDVNTLYELPWGDIDPLAVWQNMACYIEKKMGIFPNIELIKPTTEAREGNHE